MRVITGTARGRKLREPEGIAIRPTTDSVKEAIFNTIQFDIEGRRVLDLFAGTGQLGIEALSRGARECVFIDQSTAAVKLVRENLKACGLTATVLQTDAIGYLQQGQKFDLIFLDPPYDTTLVEKALQTVAKSDILMSGGIIVCETRRETVLPELSAPYRMRREKCYGRIKLTLYERQPDA